MHIGDLWWLPTMTSLQTADIILTYRAGIENEANPAACWVWSNYGFAPIVAIKYITVLVTVLAQWTCTHPKNPCKAMRRVFNVMILWNIAATLVVVLWNVR